MHRTPIDVRPLAGALGAEILDIDLARPLERAAFAAIRETFIAHGVIFFRDQTLTPEQHIAFAGHFGAINVNRFFTPVPGYPTIAEVRKEPEQRQNIGEAWHTDHSYDDVPALGSVLLAREVPEVGGDTMFASMALAYEALSDGLKRTLAPLRALHSSRHIFGPDAGYHGNDLKDRLAHPELATQDAVHPVVIRHPESGRKTLYVNPNFTVGIEGWTVEESQALLGYLYRHAVRPEFTCRFRWRNGSIAVWDNRATWHCAVNDYHGHRRLMHRITIEGSPLSA
jgi:taurine dioxygenase